MNWTEENLRNYTQRRLAQEQRAREKMQAQAAQPVLCPWCKRPVEKVSEAGWYFYRHAPSDTKCQGMWTVMEEKP
jgi:hypothetical protein